MCSSAYKSISAECGEGEVRWAYFSSTTLLILLDGWCLPDLVIVFCSIQVLTLVQRVLDHHVIVLQLEVLWSRNKTLVRIWNDGRMMSHAPRSPSLPGSPR